MNSAAIKKTLWKAIIYRIFAVLITFMISFFIIQDANKSTWIAIVVESIQFLFYISFEMVWSVNKEDENVVKDT